MKVLRNIVAAVLIASTIFTFAACNAISKKSSSPVQQLAKNYAGYLQDKFGVSEDKVKKYGPGDPLNTNPNRDKGNYYICTDKNMPTMMCFIYNDAKDAREYFVSCYDICNERFDEEHFQGDYQVALKDDSGYIVINGIDSGVGIFGDQYAVGNELYGGLYYDGNVVLMIMPRNEIAVDRVKYIISTMGLPMADGTNT